MGTAARSLRTNADAASAPFLAASIFLNILNA
jgi:hypothetical protein